MSILPFSIIGVILSVIAQLAVGMMWYSPGIFGTAWLQALPLDPSTMTMHASHIISEAIISTILAAVVGYLVHALNIVKHKDILKYSFLFWLGFVATSQFAPVIWQQASSVVWFIDTGCAAVNMYITMFIMSATRNMS